VPEKLLILHHNNSSQVVTNCIYAKRNNPRSFSEPSALLLVHATRKSFSVTRILASPKTREEAEEENRNFFPPRPASATTTSTDVESFPSSSSSCLSSFPSQIRQQLPDLSTKSHNI
jgi:hypothetical protein